MNSITKGDNSRRDGDFGVELPPQTWNYDSHKNATWDLALQKKAGGQGKKTLSMHNWAFSNIEVSESFEVVDAGTAAPGAFSGDVHALEQKIPIVLRGSHDAESVLFRGLHDDVRMEHWPRDRGSATMTRAMSLGLSAGFETRQRTRRARSWAEPENANTVWSKISTLGGEAKTTLRPPPEKRPWKA